MPDPRDRLIIWYRSTYLMIISDSGYFPVGFDDVFYVRKYRKYIKSLTDITFYGAIDLEIIEVFFLLFSIGCHERDYLFHVFVCVAFLFGEIDLWMELYSGDIAIFGSPSDDSGGYIVGYKRHHSEVSACI